MRNGDKRVFYYVQDYEPLFHPDGSREHATALATYETGEACTMFAKTRWLQQTVRKRHGRDVRLVSPSLDHDTFFPAKRPRPQNRVAAMVRPSTPRRSPAETVALAKKLAMRRSMKLAVSLFGCDPDDPVFDPVRGLNRVECVGRLKREEVANLLRRSDVFVDLSTYQAFGRASIEGMACGTCLLCREKEAVPNSPFPERTHTPSMSLTPATSTHASRGSTASTTTSPGSARGRSRPPAATR